MAIEAARTFPRISAKAYEHPADRAATAALRSIPLMDRLLKQLSELGLERRQRQVLLGNAVRLGSDQVPDLWDLHCWSAEILDVVVPPLYITQTPLVNAMTVGAKTPVVIVYSGLVTDYEPREVQAVVAHELGHVLSEHYYYTGVLYLLAQVLRGVIRTSLLAGLPVQALYFALLEWSRAAELSADRASAIVLGDPLGTSAMLMRMAGGAVDGLNLQAFLRQATEYTEEDDLFARRARFGLEQNQTHPFAVRRVKELVTWVGSGDYDRIIAGSYLRRGEEPPVSSELDAAVLHYRQRFTQMLERTAGGVNKLSDQILSWLRRQTERTNRSGHDAETDHDADREHDAEIAGDGVG